METPADTFPKQLRDLTLIMRQLAVYGAEKLVFGVIGIRAVIILGKKKVGQGIEIISRKAGLIIISQKAGLIINSGIAGLIKINSGEAGLIVNSGEADIVVISRKRT
ncbi:hypothetical protein Tco_0752008 [Tanacetum coccineum]|uniref:Uncharacterized protein n=1 Tax=Tanacetum coccineum TaxID=301880 RepID=A0ABQ4Z8W8_9ASTR